MSEFQGYCEVCGYNEDVHANRPCEKCGGKMRITRMDGMTESELDQLGDE